MKRKSGDNSIAARTTASRRKRDADTRKCDADDDLIEAYKKVMSGIGPDSLDFDSFMKEEYGKGRAKVVIDEATEKKWTKLMKIEMENASPYLKRLMAEEGKVLKDKKESENHIDPREEEFWKIEREKYRKFVEFFITKLNPIQASREYSDWNGSVLDSIIGVILTQNSADSVSSSSFMELVSKYPAQCMRTRIGNRKDQVKRKYTPTPDQEREKIYWDKIRREYASPEPRPSNRMDSVNWHAVRTAEEKVIAELIAARGQQNNLAERIKAFLKAEFEDTGDLDLEWLRNADGMTVREYLMRIRGIGLKSVECIRLLELIRPSFPVDTNVARVTTRQGIVPLQPLSVEFDQLDEFPEPDSIHKYLWPRLCMLDQRKLYELHCQMITFGKVFCTKKKPNCNACPLKGRCKYFATVSARRSKLPLTAPDEGTPYVVESPPRHSLEHDIEDILSPESNKNLEFDSDEEIKIPRAESVAKLPESWDQTKALVQKSSIPHHEKMTIVSRLKTVHKAYVLEDGHRLLKKFPKRISEDRGRYLLAIQTPSSSNKTGDRADIWKEDMKGTIMIPCRTALNSFPLAGTFFQPNEVFADFETSENPICVSREELLNLERAPVYCGTTTSICKGMDIQEVWFCFLKGYVCSKGFDRKTRAPKPLPERFNHPRGKPNTFKGWSEFDDGTREEEV